MTAQPPSPGYPPPPPAERPPDNYLVWSILATLFCCLPPGIVAIIKSSQVNGLWMQGRYAEAQAAADGAKRWVKWSVVLWIAAVVVNVIIFAILALTNDHASAAMLAAAW